MANGELPPHSSAYLTSSRCLSCVKQTTGDKGTGAPANGNKARVLGFGPTLSWQSENAKWGIEAKVIQEFAARNRPEGTVSWLRLPVRLD